MKENCGTAAGEEEILVSRMNQNRSKGKKTQGPVQGNIAKCKRIDRWEINTGMWNIMYFVEVMYYGLLVAAGGFEVIKKSLQWRLLRIK